MNHENWLSQGVYHILDGNIQSATVWVVYAISTKTAYTPHPGTPIFISLYTPPRAESLKGPLMFSNVEESGIKWVIKGYNCWIWSSAEALNGAFVPLFFLKHSWLRVWII